MGNKQFLFHGVLCCLLVQIPSVEAQSSTETEAIEKLIRVIKGTDVDMRDIACRQLAEFGPKAKSAIPALVDVIGSAESHVSRVYALGALYHIGADAVPALTMLLDHPKEVVRKEASQTLKEMGPIAHLATPALIERLKDKSPETRRQAMKD